MSFGSNLKLIRIEKGLSQSDLAELLHTDRSSISKWEREERSPTIEQAKKIAEALGVPVINLIEESKEQINVTQQIHTDLKDYVVFFSLLIMALILIPWSWPLPIAAMIVQIRKKFPKTLFLLSTVILLFCLYQFFFQFGIYLIPPMIRIF